MSKPVRLTHYTECAKELVGRRRIVLDFPRPSRHADPSTRSRLGKHMGQQAGRFQGSFIFSLPQRVRLTRLQERAKLVRIPNVAATNETKTAEYSSSPSFGNQSSGDTFQFKYADTLMRHAAASADHQRIGVVQLIGHRVSRRDRSRIELCVLRPNHAKSWQPEREVQINAPDEWLAYTSSVEHRACLGHCLMLTSEKLQRVRICRQVVRLVRPLLLAATVPRRFSFKHALLTGDAHRRLFHSLCHANDERIVKSTVSLRCHYPAVPITPRGPKS
ncbi:hypothetical protein CABS02_00920 [Colletotrichum abscissum]|uniref:Uncharacterized protein n=1 Tax=Colletotrichum abscissum TaxID=1671311 RepID=A0A9P9XRA7_9PEZI|nr:hypothetical protein CABS02_00920 [Colletotrichum abscissum]